MDEKPLINKSSNLIIMHFNQMLLEKALLIKIVNEIKALNCDIIPKMDVIKQIDLIEPNWNEICYNQAIRRVNRKIGK